MEEQIATGASIEATQQTAPQATPSAEPKVEKLSRREQVMKNLNRDNSGKPYESREDDPKRVATATANDVADKTSSKDSVTPEAKAEAKAEDEKPKKKYEHGWQRDIARLTARKEELKFKNKTLESRVKELESMIANPATPAAQRSQADRELLKTQIQRDSVVDTMQSTENEEYSSLWQQNIERNIPEDQIGEYSKSIQSFGDVTQKLPQVAIEYIFHNEHGARMLWEIAKNPDTATKLKNMHPIDLQRTLVSLAESAAKTDAVVAQPVQQSQASTPPKAIGSVGSGAPVKAIHKLPIAEQFSALRAARRR